MKTSSTLDLTSARQRRTSGYRKPMHGEHSTTSRIFGTLPCLMTSKEQSSWPRWNPSCYMVQRHGRLLQEARLDGCCTSMLRMVFSATWMDRVRNEVLYGDIPPIITKNRKRRLRMAGHYVPHLVPAASNLVLWEPTRGRASPDGQSLTCIDQLLRDTSLKTAADISTCMEQCLACHRCPRKLDQMMMMMR